MRLGWDIGGVNIKVACVDEGRVLTARGRPFELQRAPGDLVGVLRDLAREIAAAAGRDVATVSGHAVTMTAELSQMFRTKREGVEFVLDAVSAAFPSAPIHVFATDGRFLTVDAARAEPLAIAAANWAATAQIVARRHADALLVDVGTTTTDLIPIAGGIVVAMGRTDPDRLASGELVYTGALRTPVEAIASTVPFAGAAAGVSAEGFALAGDVHVWRGALEPADYSVPAPDGRPVTREYVRERLARVICADREMLDDAAIGDIADAVADAQCARVADAMKRIVARHPSVRRAVVTGLGAFIGIEAARRAGLEVVRLGSELGEEAARCAPAAAVALLVDSAPAPLRARADLNVGLYDRPRTVDVIVKVGGALLADPPQLDAALALVTQSARSRRVAIVPGGGPFADAVRDVERRIGLTDDAAHWMAILGMDQYAYLIASRLAGARVVTTVAGIHAALDAGALPVLAPFAWLRAADPLPHTWDVTGDSLAAWLAGELGARDLLLVKAAGAAGDGIVDPSFAGTVPPGISVTIVRAGVAADL